jgi:ribosomal protein S18 acetylase RimI-like enzyme
LIAKALEEARAEAARRLFLITTNDNLNALGFYQNAALRSWPSTAAQ